MVVIWTIWEHPNYGKCIRNIAMVGYNKKLQRDTLQTEVLGLGPLQYGLSLLLFILPFRLYVGHILIFYNTRLHSLGHFPRARFTQSIRNGRSISVLDAVYAYIQTWVGSHRNGGDGVRRAS